MYENLTEFTELKTYSPPDVVKAIYNPAYDRSARTLGCVEGTTLRRIQKDEEIFNNYMTFESTDDLQEYALSLQNECAGRQVGEVTEYEQAAQIRQIHQDHVVSNM